MLQLFCIANAILEFPLTPIMLLVLPIMLLILPIMPPKFST